MTKSLQDTLTEFTIACIAQQPDNIVNFAVEYFKKIQKNRKPKHNRRIDFLLSHDDNESNESIAPDITQQLLAIRRRSYFSEPYIPHDIENKSPDTTHVSYPKTDEKRLSLEFAVKKHCFLFRSLDPEQMNNVIDAMFERNVVAGEIIYEPGMDADYFYVIESGQFKMCENNRSTRFFDNYGSFGETALMYNMPREKTVLSLTDGVLWCVDRFTFRSIVLKLAVEKRQLYGELLKNVAWLRLLGEDELASLADALVAHIYQDGEILFNTGDDSTGMYFVQEGIITAHAVQKNGELKEIGRFAKGSYVGEFGLMSQSGKRRSTGIALGIVKCAFLDRLAFERLLGPCVDILKRKEYQYDHLVDEVNDQIVR